MFDFNPQFFHLYGETACFYWAPGSTFSDNQFGFTGLIPETVSLANQTISWDSTVAAFACQYSYNTNSHILTWFSSTQVFQGNSNNTIYRWLAAE